MLLVFCAVFSIFAQSNKSFSWTMGLQNMRTGELVPFSAPVQSWTGEQFRLVIETQTQAYCYVIAESAAGNEMAVLYAGRLASGEVWYSQILQLSPPRGSESLFVIVCAEEQRTLAQRITAFNANSGTAQRRALLNEIQSVRSNASRFREAPEKPVLMGGASRGGPERSQGVEYSGSEIYIKTVSIDH